MSKNSNLKAFQKEKEGLLQGKDMVGNATAEKMMPKAHMYNLCITDEKNKKKMFISNSKKKNIKANQKDSKKKKEWKYCFHQK